MLSVRRPYIGSYFQRMMRQPKNTFDKLFKHIQNYISRDWLFWEKETANK